MGVSDASRGFALFIAAFLSLWTTKIWGRTVLYCGGLSCALQDGEQHPWPLPSDASSNAPVHASSAQDGGQRMPFW